MIDPAGVNPVRIQTKDVVIWHGKKVTENIDIYFSQRRKIEAKNVSYMTGIGDAFVGFVCSVLIFAVALAIFWYQRRESGKKS